MTNATAERGANPAPDADRRIPVAVQLDLRRTLALHLRGHGDPAMRFEVSGTCWRPPRTPHGPATLLLELVDAGSALRARGWGPGAACALERVAALVGLDDDPAALVPR